MLPGWLPRDIISRKAPRKQLLRWNQCRLINHTLFLGVVKFGIYSSLLLALFLIRHALFMSCWYELCFLGSQWSGWMCRWDDISLVSSRIAFQTLYVVVNILKKFFNKQKIDISKGCLQISMWERTGECSRQEVEFNIQESNLYKNPWTR